MHEQNSIQSISGIEFQADWQPTHKLTKLYKIKPSIVTSYIWGIPNSKLILIKVYIF